MPETEHADSLLSLGRKHPQSLRIEALRLLAQGKTPGTVCDTLGVPRGTLAWWRDSSSSYRKAYALATRAGADHLAAETVELADAVPADRDEVAKVREQIRSRQWLAAHYDPDRYGERQQQPQVVVEVRRTRFRSLLGDRKIVDVEPERIERSVEEGEGGSRT